MTCRFCGRPLYRVESEGFCRICAGDRAYRAAWFVLFGNLELTSLFYLATEASAVRFRAMQIHEDLSRLVKQAAGVYVRAEGAMA